MLMHVLARMNTYPADGGSLNLNAKFHFRLFGCRSLQEFVRVLDRVWMREKIANPSQILRLFACVAMDSASSSRHGRMVHCLSVSCMCLPYIRPAFALWESMEGGALRRHALALQFATPRGLAELASPFADRQSVL